MKESPRDNGGSLRASPRIPRELPPPPGPLGVPSARFAGMAPSSVDDEGGSAAGAGTWSLMRGLFRPILPTLPPLNRVIKDEFDYWWATPLPSLFTP